MNQRISYGVSRNMSALDKAGKPCRIALCLIQFPDGKIERFAIPEGLLATIPPDKRDDFIASEVEAAVGYEVTRLQ
jgi:hypothetical protein